MSGRRVFVSGVGGELRTLVATMLEAEDWVGELVGIDFDPPRRRLIRTTYHRIHPDDHDHIVSTIVDFDPHVLVHVGVWEPNARATPRQAAPSPTGITNWRRKPQRRRPCSSATTAC